MICQEMDSMVTDLARHVAVEVEARDRVLAHVRECSRCSDRLAAEQRLSEGLLAWSAASVEEQAPPRVEERLIAAFRCQPAPVRRDRRWLAVAAAGSIAAAVLWFALKTPHPATPPSAPPTIARVEPAPPAVVPVREVKRNRRASHRPRRAVPSPRTEMATEFLPVAQDDGWTPLEGGRLVRVKLPRSALGLFGLPVDEERSPERVQADVMLSNDGLLRAIRFVK
jgi:hypothetical protein